MRNARRMAVMSASAWSFVAAASAVVVRSPSVRCQSASWRMLSAETRNTQQKAKTRIYPPRKDGLTVLARPELLVRLEHPAHVVREHAPLRAERGVRGRLELREADVREPVDEAVCLLRGGQLACLEGGEDGACAFHCVLQSG